MINMVNSSSDVQIKEAVFITPSDPTPSHVLKLSAIDSQLFLRFTIEYLLIYRPGSHHRASDQRATVARVKDALARALVPYYPLAGRVRARADGSCLEVVCRGQGAVFVESSGEYSVADFEKAPRYVSEWRNLLAFEVTDVVKGAPLLVMQLTWLSDSSAALSVGFSHCMCDGIGSVEFLKYFSHLTVACQYDATAELKLKPKPKPKPKPIWDRYLLDPTPCTLQTSHHPEFTRVTDLSNFSTRFNPDQLTPTTTTFHEWRVNELKTLVASTSQLSISSLTTFDVVSAHIWRSWARALNFPPQQTLKLLFSINIRNRVKPSLPSGYYGNAIVLGCALTTARQLTENGLSYASELIIEAKNQVDDNFVREVVDSVSLSSTRASQVPDSVGVLILSQWSKLGLENVDFGVGRPVQVCPVCTDKYCILLPVQDHSRSIKSMLAVPTEAVGRYEQQIRALE